jgi:hypothetical protein
MPAWFRETVMPDSQRSKSIISTAALLVAVATAAAVEAEKQRRATEHHAPRR